MLATQWDHRVAWFGPVLGERFPGHGSWGERADTTLEREFDRFDLEYAVVTRLA